MIKRMAIALVCLLLAAAFSFGDGKIVGNIAKSQTNSVLVAAVAGKKIRVTSLVLVAGTTATDVTFRSKPAGTGTDITPLMALGINGTLVLPINTVGWFQTAAGEALTVTTGNGATTGILLNYVLIEG